MGRLENRKQKDPILESDQGKPQEMLSSGKYLTDYGCEGTSGWGSFLRSHPQSKSF